MFRLFAAASAVASILVGVAVTVAIVVVPADLFPRLFPILRIWCLVPALWGVWAMLAPRAWVPERLHWWGGILGVIAGLLIMLVLNIPGQVLGEAVPVAWRAGGVVALTLSYFLLWILVRSAWRALGTER
jgi:hypothetical protein